MSLRSQIEVDAAKVHFGNAFEPDDMHIATVWYAAPIIGQAADAASTLIALHRIPDAMEGNPFVRPVVKDGRSIGRNSVFVAGKLAVGAGFALASHLLAKDGHRTSAKVFSGLSTALGVGASLHNLGVR